MYKLIGFFLLFLSYFSGVVASDTDNNSITTLEESSVVNEELLIDNNPLSNAPAEEVSDLTVSPSIETVPDESKQKLVNAIKKNAIEKNIEEIDNILNKYPHMVNMKFNSGGQSLKLLNLYFKLSRGNWDIEVMKVLLAKRTDKNGNDIQYNFTVGDDVDAEGTATTAISTVIISGNKDLLKLFLGAGLSSDAKANIAGETFSLRALILSLGWVDIAVKLLFNAV